MAARSRAPVRRTPDIQGGEPLFAGSTVPLQALVDHLRDGGDIAAFLTRHPGLAASQVTDLIAWSVEQVIAEERLPAGPAQASLLPRTDDHGVIVNAGDLRADQVVGRQVLCPACRSLVFRSWPEGWDAHAASRCPGVIALSPAQRKAEFKRRFQHLFR